jgi:hypothetical protein
MTGHVFLGAKPSMFALRRVSLIKFTERGSDRHANCKHGELIVALKYSTPFINEVTFKFI